MLTTSLDYRVSTRPSHMSIFTAKCKKKNSTCVSTVQWQKIAQTCPCLPRVFPTMLECFINHPFQLVVLFICEYILFIVLLACDDNLKYRNYYWIHWSQLKVREDFPEKYTFSFGHCPNYPLPHRTRCGHHFAFQKVWNRLAPPNLGVSLWQVFP